MNPLGEEGVKAILKGVTANRALKLVGLEVGSCHLRDVIHAMCSICAYKQMLCWLLLIAGSGAQLHMSCCVLVSVQQTQITPIGSGIGQVPGSVKKVDHVVKPDQFNLTVFVMKFDLSTV